MEFAAIDFETTGYENGGTNEPWQLGLAIVRDGVIVETTEWFFPTLPLNFLKIAFLPNNDGHQTHIASIIFCTYKSECRDGCL